MNVAFIPVRGGSKSIPLKNIKLMCKKPLVYWTVAAACKCKDIDIVYVATDSEHIKTAIESFKMEESFFQKVQVIGRSAESASDTASTEFAMLEFAQQHTFDNIVLIQATSPLLTEQDLEGGFALYYGENTDSVISVVRQKRFHWKVDADGVAAPTNYDVFKRPRRQEFDGYLVENGAFYITSRKGLLESSNRVSGIIRAYEMSEDTFFEIDEPQDWIIIENMLKRRLAEKKTTGKRIKLFLTDCDGCLTDGGMYYSENGDELKKFCTQDGLGFQLLREQGILCGIVTGENTELVRRRAEKLKLDILEMGVKNKLEVVKAICEQYQVELDEVAYIGDDINDLEVLKVVGFSASVPNAIEAVKQNVDYITEHYGGSGAVREVADCILKDSL